MKTKIDIRTYQTLFSEDYTVEMFAIGSGNVIDDGRAVYVEFRRAGLGGEM